MARGDIETIERVLRKEVWAVVGLTGNTARPAYAVAAFLQRQGKRIVPVNPDGADVLGEKGYRRLADIPFDVDVVDIFRNARFAGTHIDEAVDVKATAVWMQLGVIDDEAADRATAAGVDVVMDHCPAIEWSAHGPRR